MTRLLLAAGILLGSLPALASGTPASRTLALPVVRQSPQRCGPAALEAVFRFYGAGPTAVAKVGRAPTRETVTYVANVNQLWRTLNGCS